MLIDAIVLAGGRSSRLGSIPKAEFTVDGLTLLERTLNAVATARHIVIVGPTPAFALPDVVLTTREDPPFSGPAAAIAAGVAAVARATATTAATASDATLVLACDMPHVDLAIPLLVHALTEHPDSDGAIALDTDHRRQPLAAIYRTERLASSIASRQARGPLHSMSVFALIEGLSLTPVNVPVDATSDVDTWADAARLGVIAPLNSAETMYSTAQEGIPHE